MKSPALSAATADKHALYQQAVQNPEPEVRFLDRVFRRRYGRRPEFLREDFCGTAYLCAEWVRSHPSRAALGVDRHGPTLAWGRRHNLLPLGEAASRVTLVQDDVLNVRRPRADVVAATNFSWWGFKTRGQLRAYLTACRVALRDEGLLVLDIYGGPEAQIPQLEERELDGFTYIWDQDAFNPITHETRCRIHFRFGDGTELKSAFRYDWRLWTIPETEDLLREIGFTEIVVYWETADAAGQPSGVFRPGRKGDLAPAWVAYIVAFR